MYDSVADLALTVEDWSLTRHERDTSSGFVRRSTVFELHGDGHTGRGEDVTYESEDHLDPAAPPGFEFGGETTFGTFSERVGRMDLFPDPPEREDFRNYRRWAVESAALDLALKQADTSLATALGREYDPLRFIVSTRLAEDDGPPTADRVLDILDAYPGTEFKLDPTAAWDEALISDLAATDQVRVVDMKGHYEGTEVDQEPDPDLYRRVLEGFPDAVVEDPALTEAVRPTLVGEEGRVSWDAPIHGLSDVRDLPFEPEWLNIKPSRFGSVASLFETIEFCLENDVTMYGGGQFELSVGRDHIQALASVFYPDGPNDVAPGGYNDPDVGSALPTSPLEPSAEITGIGW
jgi:hypothetical protein